jgi:hypothetical protein
MNGRTIMVATKTLTFKVEVTIPREITEANLKDYVREAIVGNKKQNASTPFREITSEDVRVVRLRSA